MDTQPDFSKIRFVFFDIGGVLLSNGWGHESRAKAAEYFGFDYAEMERLHQFIFNVYEIGSITLEEYLDTVIFCVPRNFTREAFINFMMEESTELPHFLPWLIEWKKTRSNLRIYSVNNEGRELNKHRIEKFRLHRLFDAFISSCEIGLRKPDPGIFLAALGVAQAKPEECLYFDDRSYLADAARRIGIHAYVHNGYEQTKSILEKIPS